MIQLNPDGTFRIEDAEFRLQGATENWSLFDNRNLSGKKGECSRNGNELPRGRAREVSCLRKVIFQNQTLVVAQKFSRIFLDLQHNFEF